MSETIHPTATPRPSAASPPISDRSLRAFRIFSYCIAALLLATAILKIHMLVTDPFVDLRIGVHPSVLWMAASVEICTVFNLFSARTIQNVWVNLTIVFSVFSGFAFVALLTGAQSCGCTGAIPIHPIWFLIVDVLILGALFVFFPKLKCLDRNSEKGASVVSLIQNFYVEDAPIFLVAGILFPVLGLTAFGQGSLLTSPKSAAIEASGNAFGDFPYLQGSPRTVDVEITNTTDSILEIVGYQKSCSCVEIPATALKTIEPHRSIHISVVIRPLREGDFSQRAVFFVSGSKVQSVSIDFVGRFLGDE